MTLPSVKQESPGRSFRFLHHLSWSALGQIGSWTFTFLLTPYLIHRLGAENYGLYMLLSLVPGYILLMTLGSGSATIKYVAEFQAMENPRGMRSTLSLSAGISVIGAVLGAIITYIGASYCVDHLFSVPAPFREAGLWVVRCAAVSAPLIALFQFGACVLQGLQRFDWYNVLMLSQSGLMLLGAAAIVMAGGGIREVSLWYVALYAVLSLISVGLSIGQVPCLGPKHRGISLRPRQFLDYSLSLWIGQFAWILGYQMDKILISHNLSLRELTLYSVPSNLLMRLQTVPATIAAILVPMTSEIASTGTHESLARVYLKSVRALLWVVLPGMAFLFGLMPQFLGLWVGPEFGGQSVWPARLLVIAHTFLLLNFIPSTVAATSGRPRYASYCGWAQAILSLIAWRWLVPHLGILGAALGFLLGQVIPIPVLISVVHRDLLHIDFRRYVEESLLGPLVGAGVLSAFILSTHQMISGWLWFGAILISGTFLYGLSALYFLKDEDKILLKQLLRYRPLEANRGDESGRQAGVRC